MAYSAKAIANTIIKLAEEHNINDVSPMKLQKIMFYAQSWHLRIYEHRRLFSDEIKRWQYGPVVEDIYHEFKGFGNSRIICLATDALGYAPIVPDYDTETKAFLNKILEVYGKFDAFTLSNMTHQDGASWGMAGGLGSIITDDQLESGVL